MQSQNHVIHKSKEAFKNLRLYNKSVISISGIDHVGKTTLINRLCENFPDQITRFVFPTNTLREEIFNLGNIKINDYRNFYEIYNYNMAFRKDLYENLNRMLNFIGDYKILLLDRSIIDHICYFNFDLIKFVKERSKLLTHDSLLLDHRYFVSYLEEIKKAQNHYLVPNTLPDKMIEWINFISSCVFIWLPQDKITNDDKKYSKEELFIVQKIFDQLLDQLYDHKKQGLKRLNYTSVEGLLNEESGQDCTYREVKDYLVTFHDLIE